MTIQLRRAGDRGLTHIDWLRSYHSFSFGGYRDPQHERFRALRVLNDDTVSPGGGFGEHGHREMEILTWVLAGRLRHGDSLSQGGVIEPGDLQVMTAGTGIRHSEANASDREPVHFIQVWLLPNETELTPRYAQAHFEADGRRNRWQPIAAPDGEDGAAPIHASAVLRIAELEDDRTLELRNPSKRYAYLHVATGRVEADDLTLGAGDALMIDQPRELTLRAQSRSVLMWFDLA